MHTHMDMPVEGTSPSPTVKSVRRLDHDAPPVAVIGADPEQELKGGGYLGGGCLIRLQEKQLNSMQMLGNVRRYWGGSNQCSTIQNYPQNNTP